MTTTAETVTTAVDKFDSVLGKVAEALVESTNKYGPEVGEYILKTIHYDAVQWLAYSVFLLLTSSIAWCFMVSFAKHSNKEEISSDESALFMCLAFVSFIGASIAGIVGLARLLDVYQWIALFGDPKIVLTHRIMEKFL